MTSLQRLSCSSLYLVNDLWGIFEVPGPGDTMNRLPFRAYILVGKRRDKGIKIFIEREDF